jgi:uncharacterized protein YjdB
MRAWRNGFAALAIVSLVAGCKPDSGFALNLDITPGCASIDIDQLAVTATLKPSGLQAPATVNAPVFADGHRHVVILPNSDTTEILVNVVAMKDGAMVAGADLDVPVSGHQVLEMALSLGECVDGGGGDMPPPPKLMAIDITPTDPTIPVGAQMQLVATGTFSDNSVADITNMVTWGVDMPSITVSSGGMLAGVTPGLAQVKATLGAITGTDAVLVSAATLMAIEISPKNGSVGVGSTLQLTATGFYSDNTHVNITTAVTWSSANGDATIDAKGLAKGMTVGQTTVTATLGGVMGSTPLTVTAAMLISITVSPANPSVVKGTNIQFTATGNYDDNSSQDLTAQVNWSSDNAMVATVNAAGLAKGVDVGAANIIATLKKVSGMTPITVTAPMLTAVVVSPAMTTLAAGTTGNFTASGMFNDGSNQDLTATATWASSDMKIATVSNANGSQGLASALATGDVTISATFMGVTGNAKLTVGAATLTKIVVAPAMVTLHTYTSQQFTATGYYSDNTMQDLTTQVTWSSSDMSLSISNVMGAAGIATAGQTNMSTMVTVTATRNNVSGTATVTEDPSQLNSISVSPDNVKIAAGLTQQYRATGMFQDGNQDITNDALWFSMSSKIAAIGNTLGTKGLLSAVSAGMTTIFINFNQHSTQTNVTVTNAQVVSIKVTPPNQTIGVMQNEQFTAIATYTDNSTKDITSVCAWSSSNMAIATFLVNANSPGLATGESKGTVTITCTNSNKMGTTMLTVQ